MGRVATFALAAAIAAAAPARGVDSPPARAAVRLCVSLDAPAEEALAGCRSAVALGLHPDWSRAIRVYLARRLAALGRWDDAIATYRELGAQQPTEAEWPFRIGVALLLGADRAPAAEAALREALALDPQRADAWALLGAALAAQQRNPEALPAFGRSRDLDPSYLEARPALIAVEVAARSGTVWP